MSTKHVRMAADLVRFKTPLKVECGRCGNSGTLSGFDVVKLCRTQDHRRIARFVEHRVDAPGGRYCERGNEGNVPGMSRPA